MQKEALGLYAAVVLIWGTTWFAIKFQLGFVAPELSIAYRFALAGLSLLIYCLLRRLPLKLSWIDHFYIALEGLLMFSLNYLVFYWITQVITTGLVAVIFSSFVFINMFNAAIFLKQRLKFDVMLGACLGLSGICMVFWPEVSAYKRSGEAINAVLLGLLATYCASLGNMVAVRNQRKQIPIIQTHTYGMLYGALILIAWAISRDIPFTYDIRFSYTVSLLYLSLFGTVIAFGCYMLLVTRIGVDRAAYASVLFPIVALGISTVFENYQWTYISFTGLLLVLLGNILAVSNGFMRAILRPIISRLGVFVGVTK